MIPPALMGPQTSLWPPFATRWGDAAAAAAPELWLERWLPLPCPKKNETPKGWLCSAQENKEPCVPGPRFIYIYYFFFKGWLGAKIPGISMGSVGAQVVGGGMGTLFGAVFLYVHSTNLHGETDSVRGASQGSCLPHSRWPSRATGCGQVGKC